MLPPPRHPLTARRRAALAIIVVAGALVALAVVLAVGAAPFAAAERIRPLSEVVDAAFGRIRGASAAQLVVGGVMACVLYALVAAWLGERRSGRGGPRRPRGGA